MTAVVALGFLVPPAVAMDQPQPEDEMMMMMEERHLSIPAVPAMPPSMESGVAPVNGIDMYYAMYGDDDGVPVLLIHGGLAHGDVWAHQVRGLMADHRVIVADTRGHGRSTNDGSAYSYELLADDYLVLMDQLDVDRVHLVGWSDGANIGFVMAQMAPQRLASLTAHGGNVTLDGIDPSVNEDPVFGQYVRKMAEDYVAMSPAPEMFNDFLGGVAQMWATEKPGGLASLRSITVKTLVLQSAYDEAILTDHARQIALAIPGATYLEMPAVSHFALFQAPQDYTSFIRGMVR
ncbi:MAG: alpha/beta hydrolase [Alphaproteobacteria bacterium]|nr:alpha/beta hydrolase [Alphaproteobacteria bacterium]